MKAKGDKCHNKPRKWYGQMKKGRLHGKSHISSRLSKTIF